MWEIKQDNRMFVEEVDILSKLYTQAFAGYPWFENLSFEQARTRVLESADGRGFKALSDNQLVGASWFDTPTPPELIQQGRNDALLNFILDKILSTKLPTLIYIRDTLVGPEYQGKG